jgi:hypothetical protein
MNAWAFAGEWAQGCETRAVTLQNPMWTPMLTLELGPSHQSSYQPEL